MKTGDRLFLTLLVIGAGHLFGRSLCKTEEEKQEFSRLCIWIGGLGAFLLTIFHDKPKDTVNYILKYRGKRVYDGITKKHRIYTRINEHKASGKIFDEVIYDTSKTISEAQKLERYRIKRFKPKYNNQQNS